MLCFNIRLVRPLHNLSKNILNDDFIIETFEKHPLLSNSGVPDNRDLSTGSNFNPQNTLCIPLVKIFSFLGLEQN
jgi:hypothetical protein